MKNKPVAATLRASYLSHEIAKRTPKSHETIPLMIKNIYFKAVLCLHLAGSRCLGPDPHPVSDLDNTGKTVLGSF
jgi:hypothetical protein